MDRMRLAPCKSPLGSPALKNSRIVWHPCLKESRSLESWESQESKTWMHFSVLDSSDSQDSRLLRLSSLLAAGSWATVQAGSSGPRPCGSPELPEPPGPRSRWETGG